MSQIILSQVAALFMGVVIGTLLYHYFMVGIVHIRYTREVEAVKHLRKIMAQQREQIDAKNLEIFHMAQDIAEKKKLIDLYKHGRYGAFPPEGSAAYNALMGINNSMEKKDV